MPSASELDSSRGALAARPRRVDPGALVFQLSQPTSRPRGVHSSVPRLPSHALEIEALLAQAPYVRSLARALVFDAHLARDVEQETLLAALSHGPRERGALRAWLAVAVRNFATKVWRSDARREQRERRSARAESAVPSPAEVLEREDLRRALVERVLELDAPLRDVLVLRFFDELPPREIARRLGLPLETVRTREKRALALLRQRLDRRCGGREAWGALLLPLARRAPLPLAPALLTVMTLKFGLAVVVVALVGLFLWSARRSADPPRAALPSSPPSVPLADVERPAPEPSEARASGPRVEVPVVTEPEPASEAGEATGSLLLSVRWHDGTAASGITARVEPPWLAFGTHTLHVREAITGPGGECRFDRLAPGSVLVVLDRHLDEPSSARIEAGEESVLELAVPRGFDVDGVVLDPFGRPVAGAEVWLFGWGVVESGFPVASTGADGRFEVRSCSTGSLGARAARFAPSLLASLKAAEGTHVSLELVLMGPGGDVGGTVFDPEGKPVAGAFVLVGGGLKPVTHWVSEIPAGGSQPVTGMLPGPLESRADTKGVYRVRGVACGLQRVAVRAPGFAVWRGEVEVFEHGAAVLDVWLSPGVDVRGRILEANGRPARADVGAGSAFGLLGSRTTTAADGTFELADLEPGEIELWAEGERGRASTKLRGAAGDELHWEAVLETGGAIRGRLVDESGAGLAGWGVAVMDDPMPAPDSSGLITDFDHDVAQTDSEGRFVVEDCHDRPHRVEAHAPGSFFYASAWTTGVFPEREELVLRVESARLPSVVITGVVVDESGRAVSGVQIGTWSDGSSGSSPVATPDADGSFELGPYPPGTWRLSVRSQEFPGVLLGPRELLPGETWACGEIVLRPGGTLRVGASRDPATGRAAPELAVRQGASRRGELHAEGDEWRSDPLAPGTYQLAVRGAGIAAMLVPFEIRPGETSALAVRLTPGHPARIRVDGADRGQHTLVRIEDSSGAMVVEEELRSLEGGAFGVDLSLAPSTYRVEVSRAGQRAEAPLIVTPEGGPAEAALQLR